jgi:hypothetical protein
MKVSDILIESEEDNNPEDHQFKIVSNYWPLFMAKIDQVNRRARKNGFPPFEIKELGREEAMYTHPDTGAELTYELIKIEIIGKPPVFDGWKFMGTIDHVSVPGEVLVNEIPGETIPTEHRNSRGMCDHCNKIRGRKETFIVKNVDSGEIMEIGRQCLKDFLHSTSTNPAAFAWWFSQLVTGGSGFGEPDDRMIGGRVEVDISIEYALAVSNAIIEEMGFVSKSQMMNEPEGGKTPTSHWVGEYLFGQSKEATKLRREVPVEEKHKKLATEILAWGKTLDKDDKNEFMRKLAIFMHAGNVPRKYLGVIVAAPGAYKRAQEGEVERKKRDSENASKSNEHIGKPGEKIEARVTVMGIKETSGYYGTVNVIRMEDEAGNLFVWFKNGAGVAFETGDTINIKGGVKKHDEFKGRKQTILTRVKVV